MQGLIDWSEFNRMNNKAISLISPSGIKIAKTYVCPHSDQDNCDCRKPKPKLLIDAAKDYDLDLVNSWMIGDRPSDVMAGVNAGVNTILVLSGEPNVKCELATVTLPTLYEAAQYLINHQTG